MSFTTGRTLKSGRTSIKVKVKANIKLKVKVKVKLAFLGKTSTQRTMEMTALWNVTMCSPLNW
jgi:hypothetical protein